MKWNAKHIIQFLNIYQQYPLLWNFKDRDYSNIKSKNEIYQSLYNELNENNLIEDMDVKQLKAKIKSIKDVYRHELHKIEKSKKKDCDTKVYYPKLAWFEDASYLAEVLGTRNRESKWDRLKKSIEADADDVSEYVVYDIDNSCIEEQFKEKLPLRISPPLINKKQVAAEETPPEISIAIQQLNKIAQNAAEEKNVVYAIDNSCTEEEFEDNLPVESSPSSIPVKKIKKHLAVEETPSEISIAIHQMNKIAQNAAAEKQYDQFGKFIAAELRQLPQRQAILLQKEILSCIIDSKLSSLEQTIYSNTQENAISPSNSSNDDDDA